MPRSELVDAVLLAVNSAEVTCAQISAPEYDDDEVMYHDIYWLGTITSATELQDIVDMAVEVAEDMDLPLIVVTEVELEPADVPVDQIVQAPTSWRNDLLEHKSAPAYVIDVLGMPPHGPDISDVVCLRAWGCQAEVVHAIVDNLKEAA